MQPSIDAFCCGLTNWLPTMTSTTVLTIASRLAGQPMRVSPDLDPTNSATFEGMLKVRLGHTSVGSVLVPEQLFVKLGRWRFFQTIYFGPPFILFNIEDGLHVAYFNMDVGGPRSPQAVRLVVAVRSDGFVRQFDDGAQLYKCSFKGPKQIQRDAAGRARVRSDCDFDLELFHITNSEAAAGIRTSHEIWSSAWNIQGTRKLKNVAYIYLTSLPSVRDEEDLSRIAMASSGTLRFQTTSSRPIEEELTMTVYRESTTGRPNALPVTVPSAYVSPSHLILHQPASIPAYYEVVGPEIFRLGVKPGAVLSYGGALGKIDAGELKTFDYLVLGDAKNVDGLAAPYDEENTSHIMHLERLGQGEDFFSFWRTHRNSDQMIGRAFEQRQLHRDAPS